MKLLSPIAIILVISLSCQPIVFCAEHTPSEDIIGNNIMGDTFMSDVMMDDETMFIVGHNELRPRLQHVIEEGSHEIITNYLMDHGMMGQEQLEEWETERMAAHDEIHALREAGDYDAMRERVDQLRMDWASRREEVREHISQNDELRQHLMEFRQGAHEQFRNRIHEHLEQARNDSEEIITE